MKRKPNKLLLLIATPMVWAGTSAIPIPDYTASAAPAPDDGKKPADTKPTDAPAPTDKSAPAETKDADEKQMRVCTALYSWVVPLAKSMDHKTYLNTQQNQVNIALLLGFGVFHLCMSLLIARVLIWRREAERALGIPESPLRLSEGKVILPSDVHTE